MPPESEPGGRPSTRWQRVIAIGIDVGGSAIKGGAVDVDEGSLLTERIQIPTPHPSTPEAVVETIRDLVARVSPDDDEPVGVTLPSVVIDGVSWTAANIDAGWVEFDAE